MKSLEGVLMSRQTSSLSDSYNPVRRLTARRLTEQSITFLVVTPFH